MTHTICKQIYTDQSKKKALFSRFATEHPLREKKNFRRKIKITYFAKGFLQSQRNAARFGGETLRDLAEKLREISRWICMDQRFLHADSEDSDQMEKLSKCPA